MPIKELLESLEKDKEALLDAFNQLHFLSQRQREVVAQADAECVGLFIKDKAESVAVINKISSEIKKKVKQISAEGTASDKTLAEKFAMNLNKECQNSINKIASIESADKDFINKVKDSLSKELKDVDETRGKLKNIKKGYTSTDGLSYFDKQG